MRHRTVSRIAAVVTVAAAAVAVQEVPASARQVDVALEWYDVTARTLAAAGAPTQITNNRTWAISWLAATRAVRHAPRGAFSDAAVAAAVHDALVRLVPAQTAELDSALATTLARVPDGQAKSRGLAEGRARAEAAVAERANDGLDPASVNAPFPTPAPAPGVWQPTPPAYSPGIQAGNRAARPFLLRRADQFRPGPPPAVGSAVALRDLAEVRAYGSATSTVRTQSQTDVASFWYQGSQPAYVTPVRAALAESRAPLAERVRFVAVFNVVAVDTQIATSDAKYAYVAWRPVTAIRTGAVDPDPSWTPLHVTPAHPDYPSGHATYAGFAEQVLTDAAGPRPRAAFALTSPTAPGLTFQYGAWGELTRDNVNARVWSGIHTRTADEVGVRVGRAVARHDIAAFDHLLR
ncbi:vanadium-dependent haloperoxidase [Actinokineospora sp. NBRC 105648]|uniref:vanadium-dependent haloperoxidase n=1 Tax=Actinokineospora sp. NBRC 105648 TaxID=3032206 RepID=UPI0024A034D3|nr:vanadium-dependent haloperoxidase [Actinokineospora sp. NBRC 105648]GLZ40844.1 hypothetical protein Acsp05_44680 [Actinokineospora sp. NBRC 105648]